MICNNKHVLTWIEECATWLKPKSIEWVGGTKAEQDRIRALLVEDGTFTQLNSETYPNCFWSRSDPTDVARVEERTFICSKSKDEAGPTNHWNDPVDMDKKLKTMMSGCMKDRIMYVVPYLMGPAGSKYSKVGFELTDSAYVVANMQIMARVGEPALNAIGDSSIDFVKGVHSIGTLDPDGKYICHFPEENRIISYNSNYGGNALQGKKCFALRIASTIAKKEGWLAEHMLILGIEAPSGEKHYVCAAFPSACGKTNLAMLIPPEIYLKEGWKVTTVGDDIAWLNFGSDGRLYAINPEYGFFGVAPGTSDKTNPNAMRTVRANTIFTNTALDMDKMEPWWEGLGATPSNLKDWYGKSWDSASDKKAAHPNSRFTAPAAQCPCIDKEWESPGGVPISAIIFGGRRAKAAPLVYEATNWQHGTFVGATMASETTAAAAGAVGKVRRDPMAMKPFIGYHAGDYFQHWLDMGNKSGAKMPKVFHVNWFRTDSAGKFIWPGFGDNMRVLEWILGRVKGDKHADESPLGFVPKASDLRLEGLNIDASVMKSLLEVKSNEWEDDIESQAEFFASIGSKLPKEILDEHEALKSRLGL